jgi:hypothetical protein
MNSTVLLAGIGNYELKIRGKRRREHKRELL